MPPAISDDEGSMSGSETEIPSKLVTKAEDEEEEEDDDDDAEEYVVEKVMSHIFEDDGTLKYEIKWMGYSRKQDRTWEPEENLDGAQEALDEYFAKIGGRPVLGGRKRKASTAPAGTPVGKGRGRGRKSTKDASASMEPESVTKPVKKEKEPAFPQGSWEEHIMSVDTLEEVLDPKTGMPKRWAMIVWKDGRKTRHELAVLYQKCPQQMLSYYEQHLKFYTTPEVDRFPSSNGAGDD